MGNTGHFGCDRWMLLDFWSRTCGRGLRNADRTNCSCQNGESGCKIG
jgi:hypothetical protein